MVLRLLLVLLWFAWLPACEIVPRLAPGPGPALEDPAEALFQQAEQAFQRQAYQRSLQQYQTYLERYPKGRHSLQARLRQAELMGLSGDWQGALRVYESLLARGLEADAALKVRYGLGRAYFKLGHYQKAVQVLDSLTAADLPIPLRFSTNALLAETALKRGQVDHAFVRLRLASRDLAAGDREWFEDLKTRLVEQAAPADLVNLANLYRDDPLSAILLLRLAQLAQEGGRFAEAQKYVATLKERFPDSQEAAAAARLLGGQQRLFGCLIPMSGELAEVGRQVKQGMELAVQGTPVELVFKDCSDDPATAAQLTRELAQDQRLLAILGPLTSASAQAAAQAAQEAGIPLIALSQKADLTRTGNMIFQAFVTPRPQVKELVRYTLGNMGIRSYAVLAPESTYGRTFAQIFREEVQLQGGTLASVQTYPSGTTEFAEILKPLAAITDAGFASPPPFEALFIPDDVTTVAAIARQMAETPLKLVRLLGTNLLHPSETQAAEARVLDGILLADVFIASDPNPAVAQFVSAYHQRYGQAPDYLAAQAYAVVRVLVRLLEGEVSINRQDLPQKLMAFKNFPNLPWFQGLTPDRQAELGFYILTIRDGRLQMVQPPAEGRP